MKPMLPDQPKEKKKGKPVPVVLSADAVRGEYGDSVCAPCHHCVDGDANENGCFIKGVDSYTYSPVTGAITEVVEACSIRNEHGTCSHYLEDAGC